MYNVRKPGVSVDEKIVLGRLRKICLAWPAAAETRKWGHPVFIVGEKIFATLGQDQGDLCISFKARPEQREILLEDPRFFVAPYVGRFGWLSLRVDTQVDWKQLEDVLRGSYEQIAAKIPARRRVRPRRKNRPRATG